MVIGLYELLALNVLYPFAHCITLSKCDYRSIIDLLFKCFHKALGFKKDDFS